MTKGKKIADITWQNKISRRGKGNARGFYFRILVFREIRNNPSTKIQIWTGKIRYSVLAKFSQNQMEPTKLLVQNHCLIIFVNTRYFRLFHTQMTKIWRLLLKAVRFSIWFSNLFQNSGLDRGILSIFLDHCSLKAFPKVK